MTTSLDERPGRQVNVRLSDTTRDHLATLKRYYGFDNTTAVLTFILGEAALRLRHTPPSRFVLPSPDVDADDTHELSIRRDAEARARDYPAGEGPRLSGGGCAPSLSLDGDSLWRCRALATHTRLTETDALDLALREALDQRGLPEEPE